MPSDLVKQLSDPISADNPVGVQSDDDPDFDKVSTEIQKLESLHLGTDAVSPVDWGVVVQTSTAILAQKSKDIRLANWLCMGLFQQKGYSGLSDGFEICINLLEGYWDNLYPPLKRIRGRSAAFMWLASKLTPLVAKKEPVGNEAEIMQNCAKLIERLVQVIDEKFGDNSPTNAESPNLLDLRKSIQGYAVKMKVEEPASQPEKPVEQRAAAQPALTTTTAEITSVSNAHQWILKASAYIRENQPDDPIPYRLNRVIRWHPILKLPSANNGRTEFPGILPQLVQGFQNLLDNGDRDKLVRQSETNFANSPMWFDLQRFIDRAMSELGPTYQNAQNVIREEILSLVRRLPGILDLQFKNGIPFADGQTKMWIETLSPSVSGNEAQPATQASAPENSHDIEKIFAEAKLLAANGEFQKAVSLLLDRINNSSKRRDQFLWKLKLSELCLDAGHHRLAIPLLESLDDNIRQFSLEQWEPDISAGVVKALFQCKRKIMQEKQPPPPPDINDQISGLYARLCQLDMLSALALEK